MRLTRCFLNLIISSCNPLPHLFLFIVFPFFFYLIDETLFLQNSSVFDLMNTKSNAQWTRHCAIPLQIDTLIIFTLPKQTETFQWILFLYFEIYSRALVPASSRSGGHVAKKQKGKRKFFYILREFYPHKRERKKKTNKHLTGMFSLKKKKPSPYRSNINIIIITTRLFNTLVPPTPQALILFQTFRTPTHTHTHTHTLCFTNRFSFVYNTRPSQLQAIQVSIYL